MNANFELLVDVDTLIAQKKLALLCFRELQNSQSCISISLSLDGLVVNPLKDSPELLECFPIREDGLSNLDGLEDS